MKWILLALFPLTAFGQDPYTYISSSWGQGHTLYCVITKNGAESCRMDLPWQQPVAQTDPAPATFAFNTTENHTGGGGALEGTVMLALMLGLMSKRRFWYRRP